MIALGTDWPPPLFISPASIQWTVAGGEDHDSSLQLIYHQLQRFDTGLNPNVVLSEVSSHLKMAVFFMDELKPGGSRVTQGWSSYLMRWLTENDNES